MIESENAPAPLNVESDRAAVLLQTSSDPENAGFGIIDCGATETVGSLPALESLMQARFQLNGRTEEVEVSAAPPKRFKFGNGTFSMSSSCVLVPQSVGELQLRLQLYTLDCEGVPILIGMRTLRRLKAVVDFSKCLAIFVAVNPNLAIPLRRSKTGHLLIDLRGDWMQQGFRMDDIPPHLQLDDEQEEENFVASVYGVFPESEPHTDRACPRLSNVCADSHVYHGEPAVQSSSEMKASLGALASLVALHFHGRDTASAIPPLLGASFEGRRAEGQCKQGEAQEDVTCGERLGLGSGRACGSSGSTDLGPTVQWSSPGSSSRTGEPQWGERPCHVEGMPSVRTPDPVCASDRSTWSLSQGGSAERRHGSGCQRAASGAAAGQAHWESRRRAVSFEAPRAGQAPAPKSPRAECHGASCGGRRGSGWIPRQPEAGSGVPGPPDLVERRPEARTGTSSEVSGTDAKGCCPEQRCSGSYRRADASSSGEKVSERGAGGGGAGVPESGHAEWPGRGGGESSVSDEANILEFDPDPAFPPPSLESDAEACWMGHDDKMQIEAQAKDACHRAVFTFSMLEKILMLTFECAKGKSRSTVHKSEGKICNHLYGFYVFGGFSGITNRTQEFPEVTRYLNSFIHAHFPEHVWTSVQVNFNNTIRPHRDLHNRPGSQNLLLCCGAFEGGELWVEGEPLEGYPVTGRRTEDGKILRGQIFPTRERGVYFDPRALHATQPWKGFRISVSAFCVREPRNVPRDESRFLRDLWFPNPFHASVHQVMETSEIGRYDEESHVFNLEPAQRRLLHDAYSEWSEDVQGIVNQVARPSYEFQVIELCATPEGTFENVMKKHQVLTCNVNAQGKSSLKSQAGIQKTASLLEQHHAPWLWWHVPQGPRSQSCMTKGLDDPQLDRGRPQADSVREPRNFNSFRKAVQSGLMFMNQQLKRGGSVCLECPIDSAVFRLPEFKGFLNMLARQGMMYVTRTKNHKVICTSSAMSKVLHVTSSQELHDLYHQVAALFSGKHDAFFEGDPVLTVDASEILQDLDLKELESLTHIAMQLHRKMGHPGNRLLVRNLKARGADPKLLAVASQLKCEECYEGQFKYLQPVVNLEKEDTLWATVQIDAFSMKIAKAVCHFILYVDEASGYAVVDEIMRHPADSNENISTSQFLKSLHMRWIQYFGIPTVIKLDLEGAFRGIQLRDWCGTRGVRLEHAPAEFHQSIGDVERQIGFLRHKIEVFLRHEPHDPSIVAASMVGAHNHLARVHGFSPAQWALGRDLQASGHANPGPGEDVAIGTMNTSGTDLHSSMMLRKRAEQAFREQREKDLASRALNARTRSNEIFTPGDLIYYRRLKEPADQAANSIVDKSRMRIGRFYGPGRVLASETKVEPDGRKASHMIWIISQGRLKKCHSSQLRHATEQERLISKAFEQQSMPWTLSALTRLLDKGEYDDETIPSPSEQKRGRSRTPGRAASRGRLPMNEDPEPPVPGHLLHPDVLPPEDESEPELIPVPPPTTSRSRSPVPPTQDYEEPPVPAQSLVVEDWLHDVNYLPPFSGSQWTARPRKGNRGMRRGLQQTALDKEEANQSVFSVVIDAPDSEEGWKRLVKDPRKFVSKSIQKGVEVNWQKLSPEQQRAMSEAKALEVDQWIAAQACEAVRHVIPDSQLLRMRWVLTL